VLLGRKRGPGTFEQLAAIKTIRPEYASTDAVRRMFLDEAKILGGLSHANIATVHDFGEQGGTLYMVMEYVAGISFREAMHHGMPPAIAARAIAEACRGVHAAHELRDLAGNLLGVVHRDISPDNLMIGFDGHVKVIDFGIALIKNRQAPVTELGMVKGKPPYMSPEQVKNEAMDRRSDVFSLAVVLWEMLAGRRLFRGKSELETLNNVLEMPVPPPSTERPDIPASLDAVVMKALEKVGAASRCSCARSRRNFGATAQVIAQKTVAPRETRALNPCAVLALGLGGLGVDRRCDSIRQFVRRDGEMTAERRWTQFVELLRQPMVEQRRSGGACRLCALQKHLARVAQIRAQAIDDID
jgi:serine/threonine-protein kinase